MNSAPDRPLICRSTGSLSGNLAWRSVSATPLQVFLLRSAAPAPPPSRRWPPLASTMAKTTTASVGSSNWIWIGRRMVGVPGVPLFSRYLAGVDSVNR